MRTSFFRLMQRRWYGSLGDPKKPPLSSVYGDLIRSRPQIEGKPITRNPMTVHFHEQTTYPTAPEPDPEEFRFPYLNNPIVLRKEYNDDPQDPDIDVRYPDVPRKSIILTLKW